MSVSREIQIRMPELLLGRIELSSVQWMAILVWAGFAILTVCLLILMRSKWGRDKPLAKCVALSLMAHVWLALSAYGTRLVIQQPVSEREPVFHLRTIDLEAASPQDDNTLPKNVDPWELSDQQRQSEVSDVVVEEPDAASVEVSTPALASRRAIEEDTAAPWKGAGQGAAADEHRMLPQSPTVDVAPPVASNVAPAAELETPAQQDDVVSRPAEDRVDGFVAEVVAPAPQSVATSTVVSRRVSDSMESKVAEVAPLEVVDLSPLEPVRREENVDVRKLSLPEVREALAGMRPLVRPGDGRAVPQIYRLRLDAEREKWFLRMGGDADSLRAIHRALAWLARHQSIDGRWDSDQLGGGHEAKVAGHDREGAGADADTAMTGLALLAFLGAGHTQYQGDYVQVVQRGLNYLRRQQRSDGCLSGPSRLFAAMYCHGIASLALSEAYALTGDPQLRDPVARALTFSLRAQHRRGGWRYQPGDAGDMSQFGWQVMAISSARYAGLGVQESQRDRMRDFLQRCSVGSDRALAGYRPGEPASPTMSAEAMVCRVFLDQLPTPQGIERFQRYLARHAPHEGKMNLYYWYYGTLALHQLQGDAWEEWSRQLQQELVRRQVTQTEHAGSWNPDTVWGSYGGRVYSTSLATLSLEIYFRYLPIYAWQK